jgi:hypothetical protein
MMQSKRRLVYLAQWVFLMSVWAALDQEELLRTAGGAPECPCEAYGGFDIAIEGRIEVREIPRKVNPPLD